MQSLVYKFEWSHMHDSDVVVADGIVYVAEPSLLYIAVDYVTY